MLKGPPKGFVGIIRAENGSAALEVLLTKFFSIIGEHEDARYQMVKTRAFLCIFKSFLSNALSVCVCVCVCKSILYIYQREKPLITRCYYLQYK